MKARSGGTKEAPAAGPHMARVVGLVNLGHQPGFEWNGKQVESSYKVEIVYELADDRMSDGRPFWVSEELTNTDNEKGNLYQRVLATGVTFSSLEDMITMPVMITTTIKDSGWPKIVNVAGVPSGIPVQALENPTFSFDLYDENPDTEAFYALKEFTQEKLKKALDFQETPIYAELLKETTTDL